MPVLARGSNEDVVEVDCREGWSIVATAMSLSLSLVLSPPLDLVLLDLSFALERRIGTSDRSWELIGVQETLSLSSEGLIRLQITQIHARGFGIASADNDEPQPVGCSSDTCVLTSMHERASRV